MVLVCVSCKSSADADDAAHEDRLQAQMERWDDSKPARYVVQTCTLGSNPPGCVRAAVEDGRAVDTEERIYAQGLGWEPFDMPRDPLEDMFERVREGDTEECELEDVDYDESLGFVEWYELNCEGETGGRWVACFEAGTLDLEVCDILPEP